MTSSYCQQHVICIHVVPVTVSFIERIDGCNQLGDLLLLTSMGEIIMGNVLRARVLKELLVIFPLRFMIAYWKMIFVIYGSVGDAFS